MNERMGFLAATALPHIRLPCVRKQASITTSACFKHSATGLILYTSRKISAMATVLKAASIPTLSQLYRTGKLIASSKSAAPSGSATLNDKVCTIKYDITKLEVDAIVNAANSRLAGGGGVDGAINRAAGPGLQRECDTLQGCKTGSAKITGAYNLPCKRVIHAVGPIYHLHDESELLLRSCYRTSLKLAVENDCKSVAFPAISTGVYGYPKDRAAVVALDEVKTFLEQPDGEKIDKVVFCNFLDVDVDIYAETIP